MGQLAAEYSEEVNLDNGRHCRTTDHLASTRVATNQLQQVVKRYDFTPFGGRMLDTVGGRSAGEECSAAGTVRLAGRPIVFQSVVAGAPMRDNNILSRHIKSAARKLSIGWVNWQSIAFDTGAESWLDQQLQYDLWRAERSRTQLRVTKLTAD